MSKVTIYDVARVADVSLATVSRVLNNPEKVKPKTRERVLTAIKELGYRPNAIARGLASRRSTNVGLIVPTCSRASLKHHQPEKQSYFATHYSQYHFHYA